MAGLKPDAVVLVATIRALKYNGGVPKDELGGENLDALHAGIVNLGKHIENLKKYRVPVVVALNSFVSDTEAEIKYVEEFVRSKGCEYSYAEVWAKGGEGGIDLAEKVIKAADSGESDFKPLYDEKLPIREKIETIAKEIYGAGAVSYSKTAEKSIDELTRLGFDKTPVCMAKTQYSLSDDPSLLGRPEGFTLHVRDVYVSAGAGFVVALTGEIMTMPGLSKRPAAFDIDVDDDGNIVGLF